MLELLPIYCDGSDGSIWRLDKDEFNRILSGHSDARFRFVRLSDVVGLLKEAGLADSAIEKIYEKNHHSNP